MSDNGCNEMIENIMFFNETGFILGMVAIVIIGGLILLIAKRHYKRNNLVTPNWVTLVLSAMFVVALPLIGIVCVNENRHLILAGFVPIALMMALAFNIHAAMIRRIERRKGYKDKVR